MKKYFKSSVLILIVLAFLLSLSGCTSEIAKDTESAEETEAVESDTKVIKLSTDSAIIDGEVIKEFDYTWHCDPSKSHDDVKDAPAEYYTGTKPETDAAAYIDSELYYFPELPESGFKTVKYDGEDEWAYYYTDGEHDDYIFATLPHFTSKLPTDMMHSEAQAAENKVLHITKAGTYVLEGKWNGQIRIDLGDEDETFTDENAKVTIILSGVSINCSVAPGIVFYSAFECDNAWESREAHSDVTDLSDAGVNAKIRYGNSAETCTMTTPPSYTEEGQYTVYFQVEYTYQGVSMTENGVAYVWLRDDSVPEQPVGPGCKCGCGDRSTFVVSKRDLTHQPDPACLPE